VNAVKLFPVVNDSESRSRARLFRDTPILLLDEPSTGLDAASEQLVFEALERLMKRKTAIVIAHRLATVRKADVIYVLEDGRIVEAGKHQELLALSGLYSQLYDIQFKKQEVNRLSKTLPQSSTRLFMATRHKTLRRLILPQPTA
jgi:ABC-type multidrug transport system ATPase subunit